MIVSRNKFFSQKIELSHVQKSWELQDGEKQPYHSGEEGNRLRVIPGIERLDCSTETYLNLPNLLLEVPDSHDSSGKLQIFACNNNHLGSLEAKKGE